MDVACKCFSIFLCSELVPYTSLAANYSRTLQLRSSRIGGSHDINRVCIAALHTAAASAAVTRAKNGAQAERCSRGTACSQTRGPRTGTGTGTGAYSTTNDAQEQFARQRRETLTRGDGGAARRGAQWRRRCQRRSQRRCQLPRRRRRAPRSAAPKRCAASERRRPSVSASEAAQESVGVVVGRASRRRDDPAQRGAACTLQGGPVLALGGRPRARRAINCS